MNLREDQCTNLRQERRKYPKVTTDVAIPGDRNVIKKYVENIFKYKNLTHNGDSAHAEC